MFGGTRSRKGRAGPCYRPILGVRSRRDRDCRRGGCLTLPSHQEPSQECYQMEALMGRGADRKRAQLTSCVTSRFEHRR